MFEPYLHPSFSKVCVDTLLVLWIGRLASSLLFRLYVPALERMVQVLGTLEYDVPNNIYNKNKKQENVCFPK